jgi:arylsulfatase A-like enzyme
MPQPLFRQTDLAAQARLVGVDFQTPARFPLLFEAGEVGTHSASGDDGPVPASARSYTGQEVVAAYYAMIELIDHNLGRLLEALERTGQRENTIVVFMSDHGENLGDHGMLLKGCRFYEGLVRVPLIISWPGHLVSGLVSDALVELVDLPPTLLEASGSPMPRRMQGRSLMPILTGQADPHVHRDTVRSSFYHTLTPGTCSRFNGSYATMIRDRRYKLVVYHGHPVGELFDLQEDPGEFVNLWDDPDYRDIRFDLMKQSFDALAFAVDIGPEQVTAY